MLLTFGIPTLDELIEVPSQQKDRSEGAASSTESIAILGPDGTGKSVIALHLASRYAADCQRRKPALTGRAPRIIYVSSDLSEASAQRIWDKFALSVPNSRNIPFERTADAIARRRSMAINVSLKALSPSNTSGIVKFLTHDSDDPKKMEVGFVDLASNTAGDDWTFVNTLLVKLQSIDSAELGNERLPHLMIIDSVAGFETFVGKFDAYGNEQTRRSRIAQSIRNAGKHVNLVFVVEEAHTSEHLPEEYVTDIVLSLRKRSVSASTILTVEVQKARSRPQAKGEHPFEIRSGEGTSTGAWDNADSPEASNAYVEVFHSLAHRNRQVSAERNRDPLKQNETVATFGLKYLNDLLYKSKVSPKFGLKAGTATALIGDSATGKSSLGERFLTWGLKQITRDFVCLFALSEDFESAKRLPRVQHAFQRTKKSLSKSIIQLDLSDPELVVNEDLPGTKIPGESWLDALEVLKQAASEGLKKTQVSLRRVIKEDFGKDCVDTLADWEVLQDVGKASTVSKSGRSFSRKIWTELGDLKPARALAEIFRHPNLRYPGVLLTTADKRAHELAETCLRQLRPDILQAMQQAGLKSLNGRNETIENQLLPLFEEQLIVRRFEMHGVPAAAIIHVIHRNVVEANRLIFGVAYPHRRERRRLKCDRIRVVIDDLRVLNKINPETVEDGGFLSFLTFFLELEGVVSLFVHTDRMLPYRTTGDETSKSLLSVLKRAILTWNVPFEGRHRIAISVMPHNEPDKHGLVRELTIDKFGIPNVTRKLELYAGIEEGRPVPVPLAIYIFNETPQCASYVETENQLFCELFTPVEDPNPIHPSRVIFPIEAQRLLALRDYMHLQLGSQMAHTAVFQVDEYWGLSQHHALENLHSYLRLKFPEGEEDQRAEDPFGLFLGPPLSDLLDAKQNSNPINLESIEPRESVFSRQDYFRNAHYHLDGRPTVKPRLEFNPGDEDGEQEPIECRIPFTWDFGFVLIRSGPWEAAKYESIYSSTSEGALEGRFGDEDRRYIARIIPILGQPDKETKVKEVFCDLIGTNNFGALKAPEEMIGTSWRKFFGACSQVAAVHYRRTGVTVAPFDVASPSSETINVLILEIWRSEIRIESRILLGERGAVDLHQRLGNANCSLTELLRCTCSDTAFPSRSVAESFRTFREKWKDTLTPEQRLSHFKELPLGAFCLYKTWLLLLEALQFEDFLEPGDSFAFRQGHIASPEAIASRQWYKTACTFASELNNSEGIHDALIALSLPGSYTTRGDWFLGAAKASRSKLLAQNAIDLLSSRRANITRMQQGLGLPVRDIVPASACEQFRTALRCELTRSSEVDGKIVGPLLTEMNYRELCRLGADNRHDFEWQFRSKIRDYDRLSRPLQKWLGRLFRWTGDYKRARMRDWSGGYSAYDELTCKEFSIVTNYDSFLEFGNICDLLIDELAAAERPA